MHWTPLNNCSSVSYDDNFASKCPRHRGYLTKSTKSPDDVYVPYGVLMMPYLIGDPTSFDSTCRGVQQGIPALGA